MGEAVNPRKDTGLVSHDTGQDVLEDVSAVLEYLRALGFSMFPADVNTDETEKCGGTSVKSPATGKEQPMKLLCSEVRECRKCELHRQRRQTVCGDGNLHARLMFIGEAPGKEEDIQGLPFVGDAGMLLTRLIEKMGMKRQDVYIANIVKCRPPQNRDPEPAEAAACMPYLDRQIDIISPDVIVTLGRIALQALLQNPGLKISSVRGNFILYREIPVMPTYHPAYLLRNPSDKWKTWSDMQKVLEQLGLPPA